MLCVTWTMSFKVQEKRKKHTLAGPIFPEVPKNHSCVDSPLCILSLHILEKELYPSWIG